jgi:Zn-finger nucleic acid-binding protein
MKCLACKTNELEDLNLNEELKVNHCSQCGGNWMPFAEYYDWHTNNKNEVENISEENYISVTDSVTPKLCPDCGVLLRTYKVSSKLGFRIENCGSCNGIWFDKNEWETIKSHNLHHKIHNFFTDSWQKRIREDERKDFFHNLYINKLGEADYEKLKSVKKWIDENQNKSTIIAYLINKDPYKL